MLTYNKVILLPNLNALHELLNNNKDESIQMCSCLYSNRIAIKHYIKNNTNTIRIWKTKSILDYWYDDFNNCGKNFVASLDFTIYENLIKIDYLFINDDANMRLYDNPLDEYESEDLIKSLINFVKKVAMIENKNKIIMDVHENLRLYLKYYYYEGFQVTKRKCKSNPYWIETEINI